MKWILLPPWDTRWLAAIAAALVVAALLRWRRERSPSIALALRVFVIAILLFLALNPQWLLPKKNQGKPRLVVLVDTSQSMATADSVGEARLNTALKTLTNSATLDRLNKEFALDLRAFDRDVKPLNVNSNVSLGDSSNLGDALVRAISDLGEAKTQASVLLISDGRATAEGVGEAAQLALARSTPVWTWTVGGPVPRHDLAIDVAASEALGFSGSDVELSAKLHAAGYTNRSFNVEILNDGKVIERREVLPDASGSVRVVARVKAPESGEHRYIFRAAPQPDESDISNNERSIFLRSVGEKVRALVVEGQPHWDTKFLVQTLKRDPHVELTAVYRLNANRHLAVLSATGLETRMETNLFPRTIEQMNAYDVIVLGRGAEAFFDANTENLLTQFVAQRGGSVVFARGKSYGGRFQALAKLEPVAWGTGARSGVKVKVTEAGRENPIFDIGARGTLDEVFERLPALDQASATLGEKPLAVALATSSEPEGPVLVAYQRYGQGKAMSLNATGLWRWAFREQAQDESDAAYHRFWISLLQWLISSGQFLPGADTSLVSPKRYYTSEQPMQFIIGARNLDRSAYRPRLVIEGAGKTSEIEPRARGEVFIAEAGPFSPGTYKVTLRNNVGKPAELSQTMEVVSASVEKRELSADPELMRNIAQTSGGGVIEAKDVANMGDVLRRWEASRQLSYQQVALWDRWWIFASIIGLLGLEWWLRRREGFL
jgi:hypothetical protein